jgi:NAD(P)-dependent dehydrogenase (short-subunit alcohol dehydrogenase family)
MDGKTAVITGASRGIGAAVAREFADAGANLVLCARDTDRLDDVVDEIEGSGGTAVGLRADVRDEFDVERVMERAARLGGEIDLVVANAAVKHGESGELPLAEEAYSSFDDTMRTNARGVFVTVKESLPHLAPEARVLVPSGLVAREPKAGVGSYAVSKAAAEAIARQFAVELEQPVGVVDPGLVSTSLTRERGRREPEDVAPMYRWAATGLSAEEFDGSVVGLKEWKRATR